MKPALAWRVYLPNVVTPSPSTDAFNLNRSSKVVAIYYKDQIYIARRYVQSWVQMDPLEPQKKLMKAIRN
jgi:hypothetical protein